MTSTRMPKSGSLPAVRRAVFVLLVGAGVAFSPLPAHASAGGGGPSAAVAAAPAAAANHAAQTVVNTALAQRGKPYAWGGAGPNSYDCSGLTQHAYAAAGVSLPHSARMQSRMGALVSRNALQPGDLVFFYSPISHVGIYIGNGQLVHSPTAGDVVKVSSFDHMPGFQFGRRLL